MFLEIKKNTFVNTNHIVSIRKAYYQSMDMATVLYATITTLTGGIEYKMFFNTDEEQDEYFNDIMKVLSNQKE